MQSRNKSPRATCVPRKLNLGLAFALGFTSLATSAPSAYAADSFAGLGSLPSFAHGVSADGSVVVGRSDNGSNSEAFRWVANSNGTGGTMTGLGFLTGGGVWKFQPCLRRLRRW